MVEEGVVDRVSAEEENEKYEYFFPMDDKETILLIDRWKSEEALDKHHKSPMMKEIAELRDKYKLHMKVRNIELVSTTVDNWAEYDMVLIGVIQIQYNNFMWFN